MKCVHLSIGDEDVIISTYVNGIIEYHPSSSPATLRGRFSLSLTIYILCAGLASTKIKPTGATIQYTELFYLVWICSLDTYIEFLLESVITYRLFLDCEKIACRWLTPIAPIAQHFFYFFLYVFHEITDNLKYLSKIFMIFLRRNL